MHLRETEMTPYEIMLSESQERMLVICRLGKENDFEAVCKKWDLDYSRIGQVETGSHLKVYHHKALKADIPSFSLAAGDGAPVYQRESRRPSYLDKIQTLDPEKLPLPDDLEAAFKNVFSSPNIVSKKWVYEQYDYMVRTNTVIEPGGDAAVIRIKGNG